MKKGISLIELIFSIVVIGICLTAIPKVVEISLQNTIIGFKQEYIYELKSLYGSIRNLPLEDDNYCENNYSSNSLLSQYCTIIITGLHENEFAESSGVNTRFKGTRNQGSSGASVKPSNINGLMSKDIKTLKATDVLNNEINYEIRKDLDTSYEIKLETLTPTEVAKVDLEFPALNPESVVMRNLSIYDGANKVINYKVPFTKLGRLDNVYSRYVLEVK